MNMTDELATRISKGDVAVLHTSDLGLFWHDLCRYKVWAGFRVGQKVPPCVWDECDYTLATEWWFWCQPATSPFNTNHIYRCEELCVRVCNNYLKIYKKNLIGELGGINTIVSQHAIRLRFNFTGFTKTTHQMPTCHHHNERLMS